MSNYTCPQLQEDAYAGVPFQQVPDGCCRPIHVQPFTMDLHLFGFECNNQVVVFLGVLIVTVGIKLFQNLLGTWIGQLERELMQMKKTDRDFFGNSHGPCGKQGPKCLGRLGYLVWLEIIAGIIGVLSILIITGQNAVIWVTIILANAGGVLYSLKKTEPDHHSPTTELSMLIKNAKAYNDGESGEHKKAHDTILELNYLLSTLKEAPTLIEKPGLRKRLVL
jgi:hypothetical protein